MDPLQLCASTALSKDCKEILVKGSKMNMLQWPQVSMSEGESEEDGGHVLPYCTQVSKRRQCTRRENERIGNADADSCGIVPETEAF